RLHRRSGCIVRLMLRRLQPFRVLLLLGAGGAVGCATPGLSAVRAHADLGRAHLISAVPFIPQDAYQCGPAALAMVLRYYDEAGVVIRHSGTTAYRVVPYAEFERTWSARGRWTLLITPPGVAA